MIGLSYCILATVKAVIFLESKRAGPLLIPDHFNMKNGNHKDFLFCSMAQELLFGLKDPEPKPP